VNIDFTTFLLGFVVAVLVIGLALFAVVAFVIWKKRIPFKGAAALLAAVLYLISPVDVIPEIPFGPVGLLDDAGVLTLAFMYARHLLEARRAGLGVSAGLYSGSRELGQQLLRKKPVNRRHP
jgi:hypothetical protein